MGKERKAKSKKKRNGCGILPERKAAGPSQTIPRHLETALNASLQQLQMPNMEDKLCGLQTVGTLLESQESVALLMERGAARAIAPMLLDDNSLVRNAAAGTLRNFSAVHVEACEHLVDQDVMTLLIAFFQKYAENWTPKLTKCGSLDEDGDAFVQSISLVRNMCECSDIPIKHVDTAPLLPTFVRCLNRELFGDDIVIAVLQLLLILMEDNLKISSEVKILAGSPIRDFLKIANAQTADTLIKTLSIGVFLNMEPASSLSDEDLGHMMEILSNILSVDVRHMYHQISSVMPLINDTTNSTDHKQSEEAKKEVKNLKYVTDTLQIATEIVTNMCNTSDDEDEMDIDQHSGDESDFEDDGMVAQQENKPNCSIPDNISKSIQANAIVTKIHKLIISLAENVVQILQESEDGQNLLQRFYTVQSRSLLCMNNMIQNLPIANLNGLEGIYKLWVELGKLVFQISADLEEILESATMVMRATLDRFKKESIHSIENQLFKDLSQDYITPIMNGIVQSKSPEIRANLCRMVGDLGLIISSKSGSPTEIEIYISKFLIERMIKETEFWVVAEVVDVIMDLFSEDESDHLAAVVDLIGSLSSIEASIKHKTRQQRKQLGEHYAVASTVVTNLPRFIKYKRKRVDAIKQNKTVEYF